MFQIIHKRELNAQTTMLDVKAPAVARRAKPGQFIILRVDENGERIPLTIAGCNQDEGTVKIIFQKVGATTRRLGLLEEGQSILDFVGPLGRESEFGDVAGKRVAVIGGGLGIAIAYPQAAALHALGAKVDMIVGFRSMDLAILLDELQNADYQRVIAIGPMPMMRAVCELTRPYGIQTIVSMNPIMIDGTGMCGGCRLTVGGETKFACVDGPEFDGHLVDFDEAMKRSRMYRDQEKISMEKHFCNLTGEAR